MNILIITPFYKQDKNIASVRWTNIAARLAKKHNIVVVTQPHDDMDESFLLTEEDGVRVARINQKTLYEKIAVKYFGGRTGDDWQTKSFAGSDSSAIEDGFVRKLKNVVLFSTMKFKAKSYASEIVKKVLKKNENIDIVISSACPFIEMLFGFELSKKLGSKWISDFRDLPFFEDKSDDTHRQKKIMKSVLNKADAVITIASTGKEYLAKEILNDADKIHVITNGFSKDDARTSTQINDKILHLVHTGSLYGGRRKADMLFKAIQIVSKSHADYKIVLECAGGNSETLINTAEKYGLFDCVINHGFVPRNEALDMQSKADCLLAIVENMPGSLSAKLFEYMLFEKPIICITCGTESGNEATKFVRSLRLGFACEEYEGDDGVRALADYLIIQCENKLFGRKPEYNPDRNRIKEFDHDNIVKRIESLCEKVLSI